MSSKLQISVIFFVVLLATANVVTSQQNDFSFNFENFTSGHSGSNFDGFTLQGDAQISPNGDVELADPANPHWTTGRVLYTKPMSIWDSSSGRVVSFVTYFSFILDDYKNIKPGDGVMFFLVPPNSVLPNNSYGGNFGVVDSKNALNRFVGVEFDNYLNKYDPNYAHIGINVNSIISSKTVKWNRVSGSKVEVSIMYDAHSMTLSVVANSNNQIFTISQVVDLKAVLPEKIQIGISGANSWGHQTQRILSWDYASNWD